jgi:hypothetical protein
MISGWTVRWEDSADDRRLLALAYLAHPSGQRIQHPDDDGRSPLCDNEQAGDDAKLLGVHSGQRPGRLDSGPGSGFSDEPDCFHITLHTLDKDEWTEGFSVVE